MRSRFWSSKIPGLIYVTSSMFSPSIEALNDIEPSKKPSISLTRKSMPAFIPGTRAATPSALDEVHIPTDLRKRTLKASNTSSGTSPFETIHSIEHSNPIGPHTEDKANSTGQK